MGGIIGRLADVGRAVYASQEADRIVKESETMADLVARLLPVAIGLAVTAMVAPKGKAWPRKKGA